MDDMTDPLILDSFRRRFAALRSLYDDALATMGPEHVNHFERAGVLPIAFSLFHITNMIDVTFCVIAGGSPVWNDEWARRVEMSIPDHGKHRTVEEMVDQRIGNYDEFRRYFAQVWDKVAAWLADPAGAGAADLNTVLVPRPFPPHVASTFSARVAGPDGITALDALECWIYQHGLRHMGEIELARGLVGLGGMTS
jgi:hypothetical protein